jgi:hypothetical protein
MQAVASPREAGFTHLLVIRCARVGIKGMCG